MKLSVVIPIYNEEQVLPLLLDALIPVVSNIDRWDYELVLVNDGSRDRSLEMLRDAAARNSRIKVLSFARNFGHQPAVTAGLDFADGDAVVVMDADLQDPPELLVDMVKLFEQGFDVVSPRRASREGDSFFKKTTAAGFYWLMQNMVDKRIPSEVGDFRLFSKAAVQAIRRFREQHRFMRGLVAWLGLKEAVLPFHRKKRAAGETKYPLHKMLQFSWTAISSFSALPLQFAIIMGLLACGAAFAYLVYIAFAFVFLKQMVPGWTSLVFLICFFSGITLLSLGMIGDYIAKIYDEIKQRPLYVLGEVHNIPGIVAEPERVVILPARLLD